MIRLTASGRYTLNGRFIPTAVAHALLAPTRSSLTVDLAAERHLYTLDNCPICH